MGISDRKIVRTLIIRYIFLCIEDVLLDNENKSSALEYLYSDDCFVDCVWTDIEYESVIGWLHNPQYVTMQQVYKQYKVTWKKLMYDANNDILPVMMQSYRGKKWRYITLENLIPYERRADNEQAVNQNTKSAMAYKVGNS